MYDGSMAIAYIECQWVCQESPLHAEVGLPAGFLAALGISPLASLGVKLKKGIVSLGPLR